MNKAEAFAAGTYGIVAIILFVIALIIAIVWVAFPFIVRDKLNKLLAAAHVLSAQLRSIDANIARLGAVTEQASNPPRAVVVAPPSFTQCKCNVCSKNIEFESLDFDPRNPARVVCPHCGLETTLYIAAQNASRL